MNTRIESKTEISTFAAVLLLAVQRQRTKENGSKRNSQKPVSKKYHNR